MWHWQVDHTGYRSVQLHTVSAANSDYARILLEREARHSFMSWSVQNASSKNYWLGEGGNQSRRRDSRAGACSTSKSQGVQLRLIYLLALSIVQAATLSSQQLFPIIIACVTSSDRMLRWHLIILPPIFTVNAWRHILKFLTFRVHRNVDLNLAILQLRTARQYRVRSCSIACEHCSAKSIRRLLHEWKMSLQEQF